MWYGVPARWHNVHVLRGPWQQVAWSPEQVFEALLQIQKLLGAIILL